jgi:hypothetical protein
VAERFRRPGGAAATWLAGEGEPCLLVVMRTQPVRHHDQACVRESELAREHATWALGQNVGV